MDMVSRGAISESRYLGVVAVSEDADVFKHLRKKLCWPKGARLGLPGVVRMAVEAVNEDDIHERLLGAIDLGETVRLDLVWVRHVFLCGLNSE